MAIFHLGKSQNVVLNFFIRMVIFLCENGVIDICSDKNMSGLEYANDAMPDVRDTTTDIVAH